MTTRVEPGMGDATMAAALAAIAAARDRAVEPWLEEPDVEPLADVAEAAARLVAALPLTAEYPWWMDYEGDRVSLAWGCLGCGGCSDDSSGIVHADNCPALALDAALARLATGGTDAE